jgi:hypothetical protein
MGDFGIRRQGSKTKMATIFDHHTIIPFFSCFTIRLAFGEQASTTADKFYPKLQFPQKQRNSAGPCSIFRT